MKVWLVVIAVLTLGISNAHARIIDWQAELDRCRALRDNASQLLLAGEGTSGVARSSRSARRCMWIERMAVRKKIPGAKQQ